MHSKTPQIRHGGACFSKQACFAETVKIRTPKSYVAAASTRIRTAYSGPPRKKHSSAYLSRTSVKEPCYYHWWSMPFQARQLSTRTHIYAHESPDAQKSWHRDPARGQPFWACGVPRLVGTFRASLLGQCAKHRTSQARTSSPTR